jgi:hypothetical protein
MHICFDQKPPFWVLWDPNDIRVESERLVTSGPGVTESDFQSLYWISNIPVLSRFTVLKWIQFLRTVWLYTLSTTEIFPRFILNTFCQANSYARTRVPCTNFELNYAGWLAFWLGIWETFHIDDVKKIQLSPKCINQNQQFSVAGHIISGLFI